MDIKRRDFLKIAGMGAALGAGGKALWEIVEGKEVLAAARRSAQAGDKRLGMVIDTRKCFEHPDCGKCVDACHFVHNVPRIDDPRRVIKWIWREGFEDAFPEQHNPYLNDEVKERTVPVLCNHCANPPCVRVCPTQATFKRESDGIVIMDMHRCIGCRYCVAACPYGSRSFNWTDPRRSLDMDHLESQYPTRTKGVVEKCIFCVERLAEGKLPACVEACPHQAMVFGDLADPGSRISKVLAGSYTIRRKPALGTDPSVFYIL